MALALRITLLIGFMALGSLRDVFGSPLPLSARLLSQHLFIGAVLIKDAHKSAADA